MRKVKSFIALLLVLTMVLSGCGGGGEEPAAGENDGSNNESSNENGTEESGGASKDTLVVALPTDPGNIRFDNITAYTQPIMFNVTECLYKANNNGGYDGVLAESYEMDEDNLGVTIKLREGVKFHNGDELKASDVLFSLGMAKTGGFSSNLESINVDESEAVDDYEVHLKFDYVYGPWLEGLIYSPIFSEAAYKASDETTFWISPVGTGSYMIDEWSSGDQITLIRFDDYWGEPAKIKNVIFRIINETSVAMMELQTGGVDICYSVSNDDVNKLRDNPNEKLTIYEQPGTVAHYIGINNSREYLTDVRVRKALAYAIDRKALIEGSFDGNAELNDGIMGPWNTGYSDTYAGDKYPYQYDPQKAKELLAEAGYADGLKLSIIVDDTAVRRSMAEQLYNMFADVGVTLDIQQYDFATATDLLNNTTDFDLYLRGIKANTGEVFLALKAESQYRLCKLDVLPVEGYEEFDSMVSEIEREVDLKKRAEMYGKMQDKFIEDWFFWIPTVIPNTYMIHASNLKGINRVQDNIYWSSAYFE